MSRVSIRSLIGLDDAPDEVGGERRPSTKIGIDSLGIPSSFSTQSFNPDSRPWADRSVGVAADHHSAEHAEPVRNIFICIAVVFCASSR